MALSLQMLRVQTHREWVIIKNLPMGVNPVDGSPPLIAALRLHSAAATRGTLFLRSSAITASVLLSVLFCANYRQLA